MTTTAAASVEIISYGHLHGSAPESLHIDLDLRHHFRDPHRVSPQMRSMTGRDLPVSRLVLSTPGIHELLQATALQVLAFLAGPSPSTVRVGVSCAGGKHRAAATALALPSYIRAAHHGDDDLEVTVTHRDIDKPVVHR
ncbi:RapZ C-terminal domain-containing protein (plasmid) [Streptomyces sp. JL4002]|uniref:RapZ C-terminal domain-containing protein n=1 Tax=Streptomyces sp. JL4002 TaxID=3404781 RepID=UPI003B2830E6